MLPEKELRTNPHKHASTPAFSHSRTARCVHRNLDLCGGNCLELRQRADVVKRRLVLQREECCSRRESFKRTEAAAYCMHAQQA